MTVVTILRNIIGPGVISLPFTISKFGYALAPIIFIIVIVLSYFSTVLFLKVKNLCRRSNFSTIFAFLHNQRWVKTFGSSFIALRQMGICTL